MQSPKKTSPQTERKVQPSHPKLKYYLKKLIEQLGRAFPFGYN